MRSASGITMSLRTRNLIEALYGSELRDRRRPGLFRRFLRLFSRKKRRKLDAATMAIVRSHKRLLTKWRIVVASALILFVAHAVVAVHYFNILTSMQQDMFREAAKINILLQRRRNISINLARTVRDYAIHEVDIFRHLADVRASNQGIEAAASDQFEGVARQLQGLMTTKGAGLAAGAVAAADSSTPARSTFLEGEPLAAGGDAESAVEEIDSFIMDATGGELTMNGKLEGLLAVAERYPDLKLSENFRTFMDALIGTEKEISDKRMKYSDAVNNYSTTLLTFPGNIYAKVFRFDSVSYYEADPTARQFSPVEY